MRKKYDEGGNRWHKDAAREERINTGVAGAQFAIAFQCEVCWIRNLEHRDPGPRDDDFLVMLRRANLDAMLGKTAGTIRGHRNRTKQMCEYSALINKTPSLAGHGPFPLTDQVGMGLALEILVKSVNAKGRNEEFVQPKTLRQLRSTYTKNYQTSPQGVAEAASFVAGTGRVRPTSCPAQSEWYQDFWSGLEFRMGYVSRANHAISITAMVTTISFIKNEAESAEEKEDANYLWKVGAYLTFCTAALLRGYEGFYLDLSALIEHNDTGREGVIPFGVTLTSTLTQLQCANLPHVVLPLLGQFKGVNDVDHHMLNIASVSQSGLEPRWWADKLVATCLSEGRQAGPAFATASGELAVSTDYDATFREFLHKVREEHPKLLPGADNINEKFGISRTPQKTGNSRLKTAGVQEPKLDEMGRWRSIETAKGREPRERMNMLYSEAVEMMPVTWRLSHVQ